MRILFTILSLLLALGQATATPSISLVTLNCYWMMADGEGQRHGGAPGRLSGNRRRRRPGGAGPLRHGPLRSPVSDAVRSRQGHVERGRGPRHVQRVGRLGQAVEGVGPGARAVQAPGRAAHQRRDIDGHLRRPPAQADRQRRRREVAEPVPSAAAVGDAAPGQEPQGQRAARCSCPGKAGLF